MSRADHLQGEHLLVSTASFLRTSDAGGGFSGDSGVARVIRQRAGGAALGLPPRAHNSTQLLWVVSGGAVAPTARGGRIQIPAGSFVALGNDTVTDGWRAGSEGATILAFQPPEQGTSARQHLDGVVQVEPHMERLLDLDLNWRGGQNGCRRAVLGTNGNLMTLSLLSFGSPIEALPARVFPRGEIWVMLWGSAQIGGQRFERGQVGAVGPGTVYAPNDIAADTLVLVYTPLCPKEPERQAVAPWITAVNS